MSLPSLQLPVIQNWSCHNCGGCCKQHGIHITDSEKERIERQNWTASDGIPAGQPLFVKMGGWLGKSWWRLAHQPDGSCVFLDDKGLCRIHGKFGEPAKPLACRVYPYAFHPRGKELVVSLRFSCPSVVANQGQPVTKQKAELRELAAGVLEGKSRDWPPPKLTDRTQLDWPDTLRVVAALEASLADWTIPFTLRLIRTLFWVDLLAESRLAAIRGERLDELIELIAAASKAEIIEVPQVLRPPSQVARMQFRLLAGHYARKDAYDSGHGSLSGRFKLLGFALRLTSGSGQLPPLQECFKELPFETLDQSFGPLPAGTDELFTRYFAVKLRGMHFCGPAYYRVPLIEGFYSLALVYPVVLWIARWLTASAGRDRWTLADIQQALAIADHHHGFSPALGTWGFRNRVKTLAKQGEIACLAVQYVSAVKR